MIHKLSNILGRLFGTSAAAQPSSTEETLQRASQCWDETTVQRKTGKPLGWLDSSLIRDLYVLPIISGPGSQGDWFLDILTELNIDRDGHWLSLGCGSGGQEAFCLEQGLCSQLDAYDISHEAIRIAKERAYQKGLSNLHFYTGDFNTLKLTKHKYDVITMIMSLHHVAELNKLLPRIHQALKPNGWFLVNEYVGPSQFQYSEIQIKIVNQLLNLLPDRLRYDYVHNQIKQEYIKFPRAHWFQVDPSEAICSDRIEPALNRYFTIVVQRNYGGTLLNPLLEHIVDNFSADQEEDVTILRLLAYIEQKLIHEGV
ncbi:MAG: class I SAM-dependent methyltransferase, partial [Methanosarcinaceae archaeon]|nr:class I SAM-dependent methyltransferase [Methanosarcinaceae archaeon]